MIYVLDACVMIALLRGERGGEVVQQLLANRFYAHSVNLCEVHYDCCRASNRSSADLVVAGVAMAGIGSRDLRDPQKSERTCSY